MPIRAIDYNTVTRDKNGDIRALLVFVYRHGTDCTNRGITATRDQIYVICPDGNYGCRELQDRGEPIFAIERFGDYACLKEVIVVDDVVVEKSDPQLVGPMAGGNIADSCDSRWRNAAGHPLPIHDRFESAELNYALSI